MHMREEEKRGPIGVGISFEGCHRQWRRSKAAPRMASSHSCRPIHLQFRQDIFTRAWKSPGDHSDTFRPTSGLPPQEMKPTFLPQGPDLQDWNSERAIKHCLPKHKLSKLKALVNPTRGEVSVKHQDIESISKTTN